MGQITAPGRKSLLRFRTISIPSWQPPLIPIKTRNQLTVIKTGFGAAAARTPTFQWVNTALGNIKAAIVGTYRAIDQKHVPRYLAEFEYRFNRRYDLAAMMPRLTWSSVRTTPMPYRLLKLAEEST
jgi:hypothetical protein